MKITHASFFSGIGGFDIAAEWVGWDNKFWCEKDAFCQKVLTYHFKNSKGYGDIKTTDFTSWRGLIDVLTGGFPCQDISDTRSWTRNGEHIEVGINGKRSGLWFEYIRGIK